MNNFRLLFQIFLIIVFLAGIYVLVWFDGYSKKEGFTTTKSSVTTTSSSVTTTKSPTTTTSSPVTTTSGPVAIGPDGTVYTISGTTLIDASGKSYLPNDDGHITGKDGSTFNTDTNGNYYSVDSKKIIYNTSGLEILSDGINYVTGPDATFYFTDLINISFMDINDNVYPSDNSGNIYGADGSIFSVNPSGTYYAIDTNNSVYDYTGIAMAPDGIVSMFGPDSTFYFIDAANVTLVDLTQNTYSSDSNGTIIGADGSIFNMDFQGKFFSVDANSVVYDYTAAPITPDGMNYVVGPDKTFYFIDIFNIALMDINLMVYASDASGNMVGADNSIFNTYPNGTYFSVDINNVVYDFNGEKIIPDGKLFVVGPDGTFYFVIVETDLFSGTTKEYLYAMAGVPYYPDSDGYIFGSDGSIFQKDRNGLYYSTTTYGYIYGPDGILVSEPPLTQAPMTTAYSAPETTTPMANNDLYTFPPMQTIAPGTVPAYATANSKSAASTTSLSPQGVDKGYAGSVKAMNDYTYNAPPAQITDNSSYSEYDPLTSDDISKYEYVDKTDTSTQPDGLSDNPMDPNWGGVVYTQKMLESGKYNDNIITKPILFQPKGLYLPAVPSAISKPKDIY